MYLNNNNNNNYLWDKDIVGPTVFVKCKRNWRKRNLGNWVTLREVWSCNKGFAFIGGKGQIGQWEYYFFFFFLLLERCNFHDGQWIKQKQHNFEVSIFAIYVTTTFFIRQPGSYTKMSYIPLSPLAPFSSPQCIYKKVLLFLVLGWVVYLVSNQT